MSQNVQILRSLVEQRLTAAAEEIFGLFERTVREYEEELCRTKEENQRQREILDEVWSQSVFIHKTGCPTDVHELSVVKQEAPPEQQEFSPSQDQENPEPPHVIEEQEKLLTSQEAGITKFPSSSVLVKTEDDEVEVNSSQLHLRKTEKTVIVEETGAVDHGGSAPTSYFHPHGDLHSQTEDPEDTDNSDGDWIVTGESDSKTNICRKTIVTDVKFNGKRGFFCSLCDKKFANKTNLARHIFKYHTTRHMFGQSCPFCAKTFGKKENLKSHIAVHIGEKRSKSGVWDKSWRLQVKNPKCIVESSQRHQSESVEKKEFLANGSTEPMGIEDGGSQAPVTQVQAEDLEWRAAQNSFWKSRRFDRKGLLETHMGSHKEEKRFVCQFCGIKYKRYSNLSCHLNIHRGETQFHCHLCDQRFTRWSKWRTHKCILCKSCNRRFPCLSLFKRHKCGPGSAGKNAQHTNTESSVRDFGGAEPTRSSDSEEHQQPQGETEDGSGSGVYSVWKENRQRSRLKSQMKSRLSATDRPNPNEKSHACSECGKRFWTRALLLIHMRVHTGEKPFSCSECGKRFSQKANLLRHMMSHTGEKPFSCSVCTERFTQKNSLMNHMNIHKRENQFIIGN